MTSTDRILKEQKLHIDQLMLDKRVRDLVSHVADHAFVQGHVSNKNDSCKRCQELMDILFPGSVG